MEKAALQLLRRPAIRTAAFSCVPSRATSRSRSYSAPLHATRKSPSPTLVHEWLPRRHSSLSYPAAGHTSLLTRGLVSLSGWRHLWISSRAMHISGPTTPSGMAQSFSLPKPVSRSHEGLGFSACPLCHTPAIHLREMKQHLMAAHRGFAEEAVYEAAVNHRLALYEDCLGTPLPRPDEAEHRLKEIERRAALPTRTAQGHYQCNWCLIRLKPFPTRDAFLQHVALKHPELDLEEVESHVPVISSSSPAPKTPATALEGVQVSPHLPGRPTAVTGAASPTRRLAGVKPLVQQAAEDLASFQKKMPQRNLPARQLGISFPRHLDAPHGAPREAAPAPTENTSSGDGVKVLTRRGPYFGPGRFPCEVCHKVMVSELDLLQHLEGRHPELNAPGVASPASPSITYSAPGAGAGARNLSKFMKAESKAAAISSGAFSSQIVVSCDLCSSSKVYTLASALFAHIRFKHPGEDAAHHVERLIEASRHAVERYICSHCNKAFASAEALQGHVTSKHQASQAIVTRKSGTAGALGVVAEKNQWWCNECEKGFKSGRALLGHKVSKHLQDLRSHNCPACKRVFTDVFSLEEHMKLAHPTLSIEDLGLIAGVLCTDCDRRFLDVKDLQQHLLRHHPGKATLTSQATIVTSRGGVSDPGRRNTVPMPGKASQPPIVPGKPRVLQSRVTLGKMVHPGTRETELKSTSGAVSSTPAPARPAGPRKVTRLKTA